jgi:hypothetical protein
MDAVNECTFLIQPIKILKLFVKRANNDRTYSNHKTLKKLAIWCDSVLKFTNIAFNNVVVAMI